LLVRRRDKPSFIAIYDHFMPRLCLYLRGLGAPRAVAEELAHEVLLRLWQRADLYDPACAGLGTWLFRIARNLHIDQFRKEPRWLELQRAVDAEAPARQADLHSTAEAYAERVSLRQRIDALPAVQGRLIRMAYFEARSHRQIAAEVGLPLGTVKSHLRRAFLKLRGEVGSKP